MPATPVAGQACPQRHLAEHCAIVGVGNSLTLIYAPQFVLLVNNAERWGFGTNWNGRSSLALILMAALFTAAVLFALWNAYLLVRFAIAFTRVARQLRSRGCRTTGRSPHSVSTRSPDAGV